MPRIWLLLFSATATVSPLALALAQVDPGRIPVANVRTLMVAAIDSPEGTSKGVLNGPEADGITKLFNASGPLLIDVSTVRRYSEPGCSRLKVAFSQEGIHLPDKGAPRRQWVSFGINYCRNGKPPKSLT